MSRKTYTVPGIPDEEFIRGNVPMTKEEIRCLTISKHRIMPESRIVDIGAGTGSISIECALLAREGTVFAIEKNSEAIELINKNISSFELANVKVIHHSAPEALAGVGKVDRIVLGGTGGKMGEILKACREILVPGGILVINCILLESLSESLQALKEYGFDNINTLHVNISKSASLGGKTMLQPINPIFIITAERRDI